MWPLNGVELIASENAFPMHYRDDFSRGNLAALIKFYGFFHLPNFFYKVRLVIGELGQDHDFNKSNGGYRAAF